MPFDLVAGIIGITALSVLGFLVGRHLNATRRSDQPVRFVLSLLIALLFAWSLSGNLRWAAVLPDASVFSWSNLMPVLLCFTAGLATRAPGLARWQRPAAIGPLLVLAIAYAVTPVARPLLAPAWVPETGSWRGNICLQSHASTCAPAAAATLMRFSGIYVSERTMAQACLTSRQGTEPLGLYRGLSAVSARFGYHPRVASANPQEWTGGNQVPNIALVRFAAAKTGHSMQHLLGPRGEGHAVVILDRDRTGDWIIADPAFGQTKWTDQEFKRRFTGDAIYLERSAVPVPRTWSKHQFEG